jgi:serine/threonine protein kinase
MATLSGPDRLSDDDAADARDRVSRFRAAWKPDGSGGMARYLPPAGAAHRLAVLVGVAVADMERRAAAGLPFRVDTYTARFPKDLIKDRPPVEMLAAEYRLRHQHGDRPDLREYRERFPARYDELTRALQAQHGLARPTAADVPPPDESGVTRRAERIVPPADVGGTRAADRAPEPGTGGRKSTLGDSRSPAKIGDLVVTHGGNVDATPVRGTGKSTILPNDAPYELVRKLGEGAFGEVFEALAPGGVRVAVKRISRNVDHPASLAERDALEVVKNLSHPYLLKTNAYWVFDDRLVIVMELADGSLADRAAYHQSQGRMGVPPEELIPLFEQAAEALDYLHSQNVSHRDIKPENILILKKYAKVADFGLARTQEHAMSMVGQTVGTPAYMAPEMWQQKVSLRSDQYSLAATYVRCRLGRNLFDTTVLIEMASFHIHETPDLAPLSAAEQAVLLKALEKNPDDRYGSCAEFAKALRAAVLSPAVDASKSHNVLQGGTAIRSALNQQVLVAPRPDTFRTVLLVAAVAVICVVTIITALVILNRRAEPTDPGKGIAGPSGTSGTPDGKGAPVAERRPVAVPGWKPVDAADTVEVGGKLYARRLARTVAGEELVAVLIFKRFPGDVASPFYITRNKVTNRVFAQALNDALASQESTVAHVYESIKPFPVGRWKDGATGAGGRKLGVTGSQAGVPVLGVALPEALLVARELGGVSGRLPTFLEWKQAAGLTAGDARHGPAGPPTDSLSPAEKRQWLRDKNLALGLSDGPRPVSPDTGDLSQPWGVHQLVSNGMEWLGNMPGNDSPINLDGTIPVGKKEGLVIGHAPHEIDVLPPSELVPGIDEWVPRVAKKAKEPAEVKEYGFRVVIAPQ